MSRKPFPEEKGTLLTKIFALSYGIFCLLIAFLARYVDGILQAAISIIGVVCGPLLGTFTLGMFIPAANQPVRKHCMFLIYNNQLIQEN